MLGNMKKNEDQEEEKSLHLNKGVEVLLRSREKKKLELKIFDFKFNQILFGHKINFEFFVSKQETSSGRNTC
jgi:hypothetical protein